MVNTEAIWETQAIVKDEEGKLYPVPPSPPHTHKCVLSLNTFQMLSLQKKGWRANENKNPKISPRQNKSSLFPSKWTILLYNSLWTRPLSPFLKIFWSSCLQGLQSSDHYCGLAEYKVSLWNMEEDGVLQLSAGLCCCWEGYCVILNWLKCSRS